MRMNDERQNYYNDDVYSDVDTSYSSTRFSPEVQEFSLQTIQEKLGSFVETEANDASVSADVMPTEQTLTMNYRRNYQAETVVAKKWSTKTKVATVCYVAAVLILVLGISLAAVSVNGVFAQTATLTADYSTVVKNVEILDGALAAEDVNDLAAKAEQFGYVDTAQSSTQTYDKVETRPAQNFEVKTNWFDSLCDWLCEVFGG
ncbi:MAG: hypothetical protein NC132_00945 [Corallococcus sp.]|nr:hypothetical protein [Corallococcus sp.]MCM1359283.1 hypothetical protein [Corallococcus sp.]MCM1394675.1 hypothetical protein [Corallococcus sp.]